MPGSNLSGAPFQIFISVLAFLKNSKSGVDDRGHHLRSGSPVTIYPCAASDALELISHHKFTKDK